jgi:hypothetical protein
MHLICVCNMRLQTLYCPSHLVRVILSAHTLVRGSASPARTQQQPRHVEGRGHDAGCGCELGARHTATQKFSAACTPHALHASPGLSIALAGQERGG